MADDRFYTLFSIKEKHCDSIKVRVFPAEQWRDGRKGKYRVQHGGRGYKTYNGKKYISEKEVGQLLLELAGIRIPNSKDIPKPKPDLPVGTEVRAPNGTVLAGEIVYDHTRTITPPIKNEDKEWVVAVRLFNHGVQFVLVSDLQIVKRKSLR